MDPMGTLPRDVAKQLTDSVSAALKFFHRQNPQTTSQEVKEKVVNCLLQTIVDIPVDAESDNIPDAQCRICLDTVSAESRYAILEQCDHKYCEQCMRSWMDANPNQAVKCPTCRVLSLHLLLRPAFLPQGPEKAAEFESIICCQPHQLDVDEHSDLDDGEAVEMVDDTIRLPDGRTIRELTWTASTDSSDDSMETNAADFVYADSDTIPELVEDPLFNDNISIESIETISSDASLPEGALNQLFDDIADFSGASVSETDISSNSDTFEISDVSDISEIAYQSASDSDDYLDFSPETADGYTSDTEDTSGEDF